MWYNESAAVWTGIVSILVVALLLSIITTLIAQYTYQGKFKKTISTILKGALFLGIIILVVGIVAFAVKQEFHVWYPLCMIGFMLAALMLLQLLTIMRLYSSKQSKTKDSSDIPDVLASDKPEKKQEINATDKKKDKKHQSIYSSLDEKEQDHL